MSYDKLFNIVAQQAIRLVVEYTKIFLNAIIRIAFGNPMGIQKFILSINFVPTRD